MSGFMLDTSLWRVVVKFGSSCSLRSETSNCIQYTDVLLFIVCPEMEHPDYNYMTL